MDGMGTKCGWDGRDGWKGTKSGCMDGRVLRMYVCMYECMYACDGCDGPVLARSH